jgi:hypothetical protein
MNIRRTFSPLLILLLGTLITITRPASAVAPDHGPAAFGQGQFRFSGDLIDFSFDARANKNGNTHGRATFDNLSDGTSVVVRIDCLRVATSGALMTGTVLHSDDPAFPKSANVIFAAVDGALEPQPFPDMITPLFVSPFPDCHTASPPLTIFSLVGDAIQIEP